MKPIIYGLLALAFFFLPAGGEPVRLGKTVPQPWGREILKDPDTVSFRLKNLLEEGRLEDFYSLATKELEASSKRQEKDAPFSEKDYLDWLWMMYYIIAAPLTTMDNNPNVPAPRFGPHDYDIKRFALMQVGFGTNSDKDYLSYTQKHRKELKHLFASYSAEALKKVRESYDQDLKEKLKNIPFQPDENADAETNRRNYIFFTNNQISRNNDNYSLPSRIKWMEETFMSNLWYYFRGQAREMEKYIKLAGYRSEEEIDELIFRTVGRTPKVEFLYQGDRGKRYERKIRSGRESGVNDRYLHPLERKWKERRIQAGRKKAPEEHP